MKKLITFASALIILGILLTGCNIGSIMPNVITDSVGFNRTSWTIQGTGSGNKTQNFTLNEEDLDNVSASVQFVGGSAKLIVTQGTLSRTTELSGSGITQGTIQINMESFTAEEQLTMRVEIKDITGGQTTISWR